jgi:2-phosphosulfolactate phosphatase
VIVVVDVLSFSTAVTVAVGRGSAVRPAPPGPAAARTATRLGAALAVGRGEETPDRPWSLSPAALFRAPSVPELVLPSPNGSAVAARLESVEATVVVGCLRNASAVARHLASTRSRRVTVVPAGERWPDGSLRPALEDWLGAGAVVSALTRATFAELSPEARAAAVTYDATGDVAAAIRDSTSGRELRDRGYGDDVRAAVADDADDVVPHLVDGAFRPAA